ncbi:MarR family transcriptional regulator [Lentzea sp. NPDC034063]|uniref:MarR family transcriptional regulator n=1 Tax=unclassified Lentzea TaxID=2643253 RepID=UPI003404F790
MAAIEGLQPQSLTRVLHALDHKDLVARQPDERDRRTQRIVITKNGHAAPKKHVRDGNRRLAQAH